MRELAQQMRALLVGNTAIENTGRGWDGALTGAKAVGVYMNRRFKTGCLLHVAQKHQSGVRSLIVKRMNSNILEYMAEFLHDVMKAKACKKSFF